MEMAFSKRYRVGWLARSSPGERSATRFEDEVGTKDIVVVLVLVAGEDAVNAGADNLQGGVPRQTGVAGIMESATKVGVSPMRFSN